MKRFAIALSIGILTVGTAAFAQTDPNAPTGPNNPNPPAQLTGSQAPLPCNPAANAASNSAGMTAPGAMTTPAQGTQGDRQTSAAKGQAAAGAGCAAPDHPVGGSAPAPANGPHP